jgi:hypothetical protein
MEVIKKNKPKFVTFEILNSTLEIKTDKAQCIVCSQNAKFWFPLSQIQIKQIDNNYTNLIIPEWLMLKNAGIYQFVNVNYIDFTPLKP